jgi:HAD superfamily hydrolase (TIGR01549 family)
MPTPLFRGVIFDLDGTLGDTLPICCEAFRRAAEPYRGRLSDEEIMATFGPSEEGSVHMLAPGQGNACLESYLAHYEQLHDQCLQPFEGVVAMLQALREAGVRLALVTGKGPRTCDITLARFGLNEAFEHVEVGSASGPCKPECIARILDDWRIDPAEVAYVGDSPSDVRSSRAAGVYAIAAAWADSADPERLEREEPDAIFLNVAEMDAWLRERLAAPV